MTIGTSSSKRARCKKESIEGIDGLVNRDSKKKRKAKAHIDVSGATTPEEKVENGASLKSSGLFKEAEAVKTMILQYQFIFQQYFHECWKSWRDGLELISSKPKDIEDIETTTHVLQPLEKKDSALVAIPQPVDPTPPLDGITKALVLENITNNPAKDEEVIESKIVVTNVTKASIKIKSSIPKLVLPPPPPFPPVKSISQASNADNQVRDHNEAETNVEHAQEVVRHGLENPFEISVPYQEKWQTDREKLRRALEALKTVPEDKTVLIESNNQKDTMASLTEDQPIPEKIPPTTSFVHDELLPNLLFSPILETNFSIDKLDAVSIVMYSSGSRSEKSDTSDKITILEDHEQQKNVELDKDSQQSDKNIDTSNIKPVMLNNISNAKKTPQKSNMNIFSQKTPVSRALRTGAEFHIPSPKVKAFTGTAKLDHVKLSPAGMFPMKTKPIPQASLVESKKKILMITSAASKDKQTIGSISKNNESTKTEPFVETVKKEDASVNSTKKPPPFIASGSSVNYQQNRSSTKNQTISVGITPKKPPKQPAQEVSTLKNQAPTKSTTIVLKANQTKPMPQPICLISPLNTKNHTQPQSNAANSIISKASLPEITSDEEDFLISDDPLLSPRQTSNTPNRDLPVPHWVQHAILQTSLEMQAKVNPDDIFGHSLPHLEIEKVFAERYSNSSASLKRSMALPAKNSLVPGKENQNTKKATSNTKELSKAEDESWTMGSDQLTPRQIKSYNLQMGYEQ
jgi:hypothetical protein